MKKILYLIFSAVLVVSLLTSCALPKQNELSGGVQINESVAKNISVLMQFYKKEIITKEDMKQLREMSQNVGVFDNYKCRAVCLCSFNNNSDRNLKQVTTKEIKNEDIFLEGHMIDEGGYTYLAKDSYKFIVYLYFKNDLSEEEMLKIINSNTFQFEYLIDDGSENNSSEQSSYTCTAEIVTDKLPTDLDDYYSSAEYF